MKNDTFTFNASDGVKIFVYKWLPDDSSTVKGAVQIAHGMAEHAARYERFADALTKAGYAVYANDHRGHGKTAGNQNNIGYFADEPASLSFFLATAWVRFFHAIIPCCIPKNFPD
jgi:alpha-beta hydrolase superfamily lysophospholipase